MKRTNKKRRKRKREGKRAQKMGKCDYGMQNPIPLPFEPLGLPVPWAKQRTETQAGARAALLTHWLVACPDDLTLGDRGAETPKGGPLLLLVMPFLVVPPDVNGLRGEGGPSCPIRRRVTARSGVCETSLASVIRRVGRLGVLLFFFLHHVILENGPGAKVVSAHSSAH